MNYLAISQLLRPETFFLCKEKLDDEMNKIDDIEELRLNITELNAFLYTSYILRYQKNFNNILERNRAYIKDASSVIGLKQIAYEIIDNYKEVAIEVLQNNDDRLIRQAINEINENYYTKLTLKQIADKLFVTENYLCRLFSEKTGYRFCEYLNSLRVKKAKELLMEGSKSLDYISDVCGFSSQAHFSITFKKYYNISPGKFKLNIKNEKLKQLM